MDALTNFSFKTLTEFPESDTNFIEKRSIKPIP